MNRFDQLLDSFAHTFYGYGDYKASYWFIGMEEGGASSRQEIESRLSVWDRHRKPELEDIAVFHNEIGYRRYFEKRPPLQNAWNKLIRILLSAEGKLLREKTDVARTELVREYQRTSLGRRGGQSCLLELLPLPSKSISDWLYAEHTTLDYCANRDVYKTHFMPRRADHIKVVLTHVRGVVCLVLPAVSSTEYSNWSRPSLSNTIHEDSPRSCLNWRRCSAGRLSSWSQVSLGPREGKPKREGSWSTWRLHWLRLVVGCCRTCCVCWLERNGRSCLGKL
jgi:hypothetical protein